MAREIKEGVVTIQAPIAAPFAYARTTRINGESRVTLPIRIRPVDKALAQIIRCIPRRLRSQLVGTVLVRLPSVKAAVTFPIKDSSNPRSNK